MSQELADRPFRFGHSLFTVKGLARPLWLGTNRFCCGNCGEAAMRDIRNDLTTTCKIDRRRDRGGIRPVRAEAGAVADERDGRVAELQAELAALSKLIEFEHRRMANEEQRRIGQRGAAGASSGPPAAASTLACRLHHAQAERDRALSKDDLVNLTLQEGIFADPESADHGIHGTLVNVIRNEYIRQLHDGTFVPNTLPPALRRHAG